MSGITPDILALEAEAAKGFHSQLGRTIARWGSIEAHLCTYFWRITGMTPRMARAVFFSARSFKGRQDMIKAAINIATFGEEGMEAFVRACVKRAGQYSEFRNRIAHSEVIYINSTASRYNGQHIIIQGKDFFSDDAGGDSIVTLSDLEIAEENFARLGYCMTMVLNWNGKDVQKSPSKYLQLVQALPNPAHSARLDQSVLEPFELGELILPSYRQG